jgi:hypothetical protein
LDEALERFVEAQYFESRLSAGADQLDHLVAFPRRAAAAVHRQLADALPCRAAESRALWEAVTRAFEAWCDGQSWLSKHVPTVWLEYDDVRAGGAQRAVPSICFCMVPGYQCDRALIASDGRRERHITREVLGVLPLQLTASQQHALSACLDEPSIRWIHLSAMLGRERPTLKLYGLARRSELGGCLRRLDFGGDVTDLLGFMHEHYPVELLGEEAFIDVDLTTWVDTERASLGLAVGQRHVAGRDADGLQRALLERWSRGGLCDPVKQRQLLDWMALRHAAGARELGRRCFLDFKLVWRAQGAPLAKAYRGLYGGARVPD